VPGSAAAAETGLKPWNLFGKKAGLMSSYEILGLGAGKGQQQPEEGLQQNNGSRSRRKCYFNYRPEGLQSGAGSFAKRELQILQNLQETVFQMQDNLFNDVQQSAILDFSKYSYGCR
jgi:hypothetical protein